MARPKPCHARNNWGSCRWLLQVSVVRSDFVDAGALDAVTRVQMRTNIRGSFGVARLCGGEHVRIKIDSTGSIYFYFQSFHPLSVNSEPWT